MTNNLPKSLHTVRVLVQVARLIRHYEPTIGAIEAIEAAAMQLGYGKTPDAYTLKAKALAQLQKGN